MRQDERKCRSLARRALDPDRSPVQFDKMLGEREAESGALGVALVVADGLAEFLEHLRLLVGRDADAGVDDRDLDTLFYVPRTRCHPSTGRRELDGVGQQRSCPDFADTFSLKEESKLPTPKPPYPAAFRQQMVELVRAGRGVSDLAREFGCNASSILG